MTVFNEVSNFKNLCLNNAMTVTIKNIPEHIGTYSIKDLCRRHGKLESCLRLEKGVVKIKMVHEQDAKKLQKEVNGMTLLGNILEVSLEKKAPTVRKGRPQSN